MAAQSFNIAGKTPQELGQELTSHIGKGEWVANEEYVSKLLDAGATLEETDDKGNTPLLLTAIHGLPKIAQLLVDKNANINAVNKRGDNVLHMTLDKPGFEQSYDDFLPIADMVLAKNIDVNAVNELKQSPLSVAAKEHLYKYTQTLVDRGANLDQVDWEGKTPLEQARTGSNGDATAKVIEEAIAVRDARCKLEAQQRAMDELRQEVSAIVGIVGKGSGQQHAAPATAKFKARKIESL